MNFFALGSFLQLQDNLETHKFCFFTGFLALWQLVAAKDLLCCFAFSAICITKEFQHQPKILNPEYQNKDNLKFVFSALNSLKTLQESQKALPRTSHRLSRCQVIFTKRCHYCYCQYCYFHYCHYYYCLNLNLFFSQFIFF